MSDETIPTFRINDGIMGDLPRLCTGTGTRFFEGDWYIAIDHPMFAELLHHYLDPLTEAARVMKATCKGGVA